MRIPRASVARWNRCILGPSRTVAAAIARQVKTDAGGPRHKPPRPAVQIGVGHGQGKTEKKTGRKVCCPRRELGPNVGKQVGPRKVRRANRADGGGSAGGERRGAGATQVMVSVGVAAVNSTTPRGPRRGQSAGGMNQIFCPISRGEVTRAKAEVGPIDRGG